MGDDTPQVTIDAAPGDFRPGAARQGWQCTAESIIAPITGLSSGIGGSDEQTDKLDFWRISEHYCMLLISIII